MKTQRTAQWLFAFAAALAAGISASGDEPGKNKPAEPAKPATKPAETKPADKPAEKPAEKAKPAESKPGDSKPPETKPIDPKAATPAKPSATPAEQIMKDLEKAAGSREAGQNASSGGGGAATNGEGPAKLLREGSFITSRRGRMSKSPGGDWVFTFDGDANGRVDAPVVLMPCMNLMAMERVAEKGGDTVTFTLSGQVFVYKGRNHVLPTIFVVNRKGELTPAG